MDAVSKSSGLSMREGPFWSVSVAIVAIVLVDRTVEINVANANEIRLL